MNTGNYREALRFQVGQQITFDRDLFIQSRPPHIQPFLENMLQLQVKTTKVIVIKIVMGLLLADLKNQPIVSSCVTDILPFCSYFKGQEEICFNPTSWHLVTYNFL